MSFCGIKHVEVEIHIDFLGTLFPSSLNHSLLLLLSCSCEFVFLLSFYNKDYILPLPPSIWSHVLR
jgi:hypothetical protein